MGAVRVDLSPEPPLEEEGNKRKKKDRERSKAKARSKATPGMEGGQGNMEGGLQVQGQEVGMTGLDVEEGEVGGKSKKRKRKRREEEGNGAVGAVGDDHDGGVQADKKKKKKRDRQAGIAESVPNVPTSTAPQEQEIGDNFPPILSAQTAPQEKRKKKEKKKTRQAAPTTLDDGRQEEGSRQQTNTISAMYPFEWPQPLPASQQNNYQQHQQQAPSFTHFHNLANGNNLPSFFGPSINNTFQYGIQDGPNNIFDIAASQSQAPGITSSFDGANNQLDFSPLLNLGLPFLNVPGFGDNTNINVGDSNFAGGSNVSGFGGPGIAGNGASPGGALPVTSGAMGGNGIVGVPGLDQLIQDDPSDEIYRTLLAMGIINPLPASSSTGDVQDQISQMGGAVPATNAGPEPSSDKQGKKSKKKGKKSNEQQQQTSNVVSSPSLVVTPPAPLAPTTAATTTTATNSSSKVTSNSTTRAPSRTDSNSSSAAIKMSKKCQNLLASVAGISNQEILTTKWLGTDELRLLQEERGLDYKKGKFSATEENAIETALHRYRQKHDVDLEGIRNIIFSKSRAEGHSTFWTSLALAVEGRPLTALYHHVRRKYHPLHYQGVWSPEEDDKLRRAVAEFGASSWEKISTRVGRSPMDCRDRWKNHVSEETADKKTGHWTKSEEEMLVEIVLSLTSGQGKTIDSQGIPWGEVSKRMGGQRGRQQCRVKWHDDLVKSYKAGHQADVRWSKKDTFILISKLAALNVRDETEINWKSLPDKDWNLYSAHLLHTRWTGLKKKGLTKFFGGSPTDFKTLISTLKEEQNQLPKEVINRPPAKNYHKLQPLSKDYAEDQDLVDDDEDDEDDE